MSRYHEEKDAESLLKDLNGIGIGNFTIDIDKFPEKIILTRDGVRETDKVHEIYLELEGKNLGKRKIEIFQYLWRKIQKNSADKYVLTTTPELYVFEMKKDTEKEKQGEKSNPFQPQSAA